jgi:hypothetical protein
MIAMWPGYSWCYGWARCGAPTFQAYPFGSFGYEWSWYGSSWYFAANYRWGPRFAHHHRYHRVPREMIASATGNGRPDAQSAGLHELDVGEPRLALASADPQTMMNLGIGSSSSNEQAATLALRKRPTNGVPAINVVPSCRAGAAVGIDQSIDVCLGQEMRARDQLAREWDQVPPTDRSSCVRVATIGGGGSYTAVLSCIEMKRDARNLSKENTSALVAGR